jgi:hypothetical protein
MKQPFGIPGIGGSLGECAICGNPFIMEILLGEKISSFTLKGVENTLYGHKNCMPLLKCETLLDLPKESPVRRAVERHLKTKTETV